MRPTSLQSDRMLPSNLEHIGRFTKQSTSDRIVAALTGPEAIGLFIFCAFGLLLTAVFNLLVPNFAEVAASLQPFF